MDNNELRVNFVVDYEEVKGFTVVMNLNIDNLENLPDELRDTAKQIVEKVKEQNELTKKLAEETPKEVVGD